MKESITIEKKLFESLFKEWIEHYHTVDTNRWESLSLYEVDILTKELRKDFYENWLLGKIEFRYIKDPKSSKKNKK